MIFKTAKSGLFYLLKVIVNMANKENIKSIVNRLINKIGDESKTSVLSEVDHFKTVKNWVASGCPELDYNLSTLGIPYGMIELSGKSKGGKTTLAYHFLKNFLDTNENGIGFILSSERRESSFYCEAIGIDTSRVIVIYFSYIEELSHEVYNIMESIRGEDVKPFFIWDSVSSTLCKNEVDVMKDNFSTYNKAVQKGKDSDDIDFSSEKPGAFAKEGKKFAKFLTSLIYDEKFVFICINHVYDKIGFMQKGVKSGGGEWVEFFPTMRLRLSSKDFEKLDDVEIIQNSEVKVEKSDFGSRKKTTIRILIGHGLMLTENDLDYAVERGILEKKGARIYNFMNQISWGTLREFVELYKEKNVFLKKLHKKIQESRHKDVLIERGILSEDKSNEEA